MRREATWRTCLGTDGESFRLSSNERRSSGSDLPYGLQPATHPTRDAAAWAHARATDPSSAWAAPSRPGAAAGLESAVVFGRVSHPVLERRGGLRHRWSCPGDSGVDGLAAPLDRCRTSER